MPKSIFDLVIELPVKDNFSQHYKRLNLYSGWHLIDRLECDAAAKNKLARYVAFAYSLQSDLIHKNRDRKQERIRIAIFCDLDLTDFIKDCIELKNDDFNKYISWWIKENENSLWNEVISGYDLHAELMEVAREGIEFRFGFDIEKEMEDQISKNIKRAILQNKAKAEAYKNAILIREQADRSLKQLEKESESFYKMVASENTELLGTLPLAEKLVLKRKNKNETSLQ